MARADVVIALVVNGVTHRSTISTKAALVSQGFADANILVHADFSGLAPASDIIVLVRGVSVLNSYNNAIKPRFDAGTPVIFGCQRLTATGTAVEMAATYADLTGPWHSVAATSGTENTNITNNTHPITAGQSLGSQAIYTVDSQTWALPVSDPASSLALAAPPSGIGADMVNTADIIPLESGHINMLGNPTAARCVLWGGLYGGAIVASSYTEVGAELLAASVDWALGIGGPEPSRRRSPLLLTPW